MARATHSKIRTNIDAYVKEVTSLIHASPAERTRIEADLRAHLQEGLEHGEDPADLIARMGEPREVAAGFMEQVPLVYAGHWRRLAAFMVDMLIILLFAGAAATLTIFLANLVPQHPTGIENIVGGIIILLVLVSANSAIAMILMYFPVLEGRFGQTLGKRLFHLTVLADDGLPLDYGNAFLRRLSFYFDILPIDALFIFLNDKRQRGFDILAKTIVVEG